jgi:hypothetical protein
MQGVDASIHSLKDRPRSKSYASNCGGEKSYNIFRLPFLASRNMVQNFHPAHTFSWRGFQRRGRPGNHRLHIAAKPERQILFLSFLLECSGIRTCEAEARS